MSSTRTRLGALVVAVAVVVVVVVVFATRGAEKPTKPSGDDGGLEEGTKVEANWKGAGTWYRGKNSRNRGDGTYDIDYADGGKEAGVGKDKIRMVCLVEPVASSVEIVPGLRIYNAAKEGDMAALRTLVQEWSGNDVLNWSNPDNAGYTPLIVGSSEAPLIDVNKPDRNGDTALATATVKGCTEVVKLLLTAPGINVNAASKDGETAVMKAAKNGHAEVVRALLAAPGIDVNKTDNDGWMALMRAAFKGHTEIVKALVAAPGIDVNKADNSGYTALMLATSQQHTEIVRSLLAVPGIEVNKETLGAENSGLTPLDVALDVAKDKPEIAALLRAAGGGVGGVAAEQ